MGSFRKQLLYAILRPVEELGHCLDVLKGMIFGPISGYEQDQASLRS